MPVHTRTHIHACICVCDTCIMSILSMHDIVNTLSNNVYNIVLLFVIVTIGHVMSCTNIPFYCKG